MPLTIAALQEKTPGESRVAVTPETVKKLKALGYNVRLQSGAGKTAGFLDSEYKEAGAILKTDIEDVLKSATILLCVQTPDLKNIPAKTLIIGQHAPHGQSKNLDEAAKGNLSLFSLELLPRITRAQNMDVLSSQSNLSGYKAVLDAAEHFPRAFPMMMTAAGTIPPAKVFIMGAGVAGLQAIATARRLGALVTATDVRPAAKEQVESLGASFVAVEDDEFKEAETAGGYAKEMSKAYQKKQAALIEDHIKSQDIVITTALIPGRPAPKLISETMVKSMKPGSVIVDLAVDTGGNCALSEAGKVVSKHDVTIVGHKNVPGRLPHDASSLYARNLLNFVSFITEKDKAELKIDWEDEIIKGTCLTKDKKVIHPLFIKKEKAPAKTTPKKTTAKKA